MVLFERGEVIRKDISMNNFSIILFSFSFSGSIKNIMLCNVPLTPVLEIRLIDVSFT